MPQDCIVNIRSTELRLRELPSVIYFAHPGGRHQTLMTLQKMRPHFDALQWLGITKIP